MSIKWKTTGKKYVRFHTSNSPRKIKQGATSRPARYLQIKFTVKGKTFVSSAGWESREITIAKVAKDAIFFHANATAGRRPRTYQELKQDQAIDLIENGQGHKVAGITFAEACEQWKENQDQAASGWYSVLNKINYWILPYLGDKALHDLTADDWQTIRKDMKRGYSRGGASKCDGQERSKTTVNNVLQIVKRIFTYGKDRYPELKLQPVFKTCKVEGLTRHHRSRQRRRVLDDNELRLIMDTLKARNRRTWRLAVVSAETGGRVSEIYGCLWKDYNAKKNTLHFEETKNGYDRTVKLTATAKAVIEEINRQGRGRNDHIFLNSYDKPHTATPKIYRTVVKQLGFNKGVTDDRDKVVFHTLRHTLATKLSHLEGFSLKDLQALFGWKDPRTVLRYSHEDLEKQADDLEAVSPLSIVDDSNVIPLKRKA